MIHKHLRLAVLRALVVGSLMLVGGVFPFLIAPNLLQEGLGAKPLSATHALFYSLFPYLLIALAVGGLAFFLWGVCLLVKPAWHPTLRRLGRYGPPEDVADAIDAELADNADTTRIGEPMRSFRLARTEQVHDPVYVTRSWVVQPIGLGVKVVRLDEIVWVRGQGFTIARRGAAEGQAVGVKLRDGSEERFVLSATNAPRLVLEIVRRLPWVHSGTDEILERRWQSQRTEFLDAFDRHREQIQALPAERREELIRGKAEDVNREPRRGGIE